MLTENIELQIAYYICISIKYMYICIKIEKEDRN